MVNGKTVAVIVAAGRGSRAGPGGPKQYRLLAGEPILARTARAFLDHPDIDAVRIIIHRDDGNEYESAMSGIRDHPKLLAPVHGGAERQDSVRLGLESLSSENPSSVLIHDAARPFIDYNSIAKIVAALAENDGAIAALPVHDTIKKAGAGDTIKATIPRDAIWRAQTPQGFKYNKILAAHRRAEGKALTDDAAVAEAAGLSIRLVRSSPDNMKITQAEDFGMAEKILSRTSAQMEYRTGIGFDVHAFEDGNAVVICGVKIPHSAKLKGHSDADVGMHALTDAIFGAVSAGDIGDHFPPSDPQWKGAPSRIFLEKARDVVSDQNGEITHCDVTLICEAPKIGPHRGAMREALSKILRIEENSVSVKATTSEQLGFTGRREGIAALANATIALPRGR
ncbi:MAG: bifunctional 2-C-methyl-D-erythritol 4-phosphate cytidylyltransferase/2-C-methyl-D-erythritol 2,4-cyclodiphosphate synthase [Marinicaulis sp.]|nr:bifunctional 2-C-methyl-D-erythritol 4-phosphate cytidylyltransferase/2-C-methyl-D-erythritol 2,4-cyclodiphosphate synthase [Marinicaulis sp.]NNE42212.1 bifunctional 2-C-methyl-D-erythritol 4-phosphate cytidylyltransferase/2-C-methyl-D-erythritol 2,4-cyclodiphosphate synthase [Marinicaulis sp.]NNL89108.1 bifunctional 2-C-methyl-D-erythritol 4-phosphate cytidylyltransferase/2-C-methyl-D-erythritol 2,4-cyclodiphosphate synthase [Marinicaulis sp.]